MSSSRRRRSTGSTRQFVMQRRTRGEPVEKLRERTARALGTPLRDALAYHVGRLEDLTVADAALPVELDDRAQDGWEPLIAIADAAGGDWPTRARRAAIAIFADRSVADDNLGLRLLTDCREVFAPRTLRGMGAASPLRRRDLGGADSRPGGRPVPRRRSHRSGRSGTGFTGPTGWSRPGPDRTPDARPGLGPRRGTDR